MAFAIDSSCSSAKCRPISCSPIGSRFEDNVTGRVTAGKPTSQQNCRFFTTIKLCTGWAKKSAPPFHSYGISDTKYVRKTVTF